MRTRKFWVGILANGSNRPKPHTTLRTCHRSFAAFERAVDCQPWYGEAWQGRWCADGAPRLETGLVDELFHRHGSRS